MIEEYVDKLVKEQTKHLDGLIRKSFRQHFGFPIDEVEDKEGFEHCLIEGDTIEFYRYHGHTFLLYDRGLQRIEYNKTDSSVTAIVEPKFLQV